MTADAPEQLLAELCRDLRLLWIEAGGPSLRQLGQRVSLGKSQVGAILGGQVRELPSWDVVRGLVEEFGAYAQRHGRTGRLSLRTGVEQYWRPRYAILDFAFGQRRQRPRRAPAVVTEKAQLRPGKMAVPRQLPPPPRHFTGRAAELDALSALVAERADSVLIPVIAGTAGIGKTALAVHWAHRVTALFPDGQLYVNLRGFDPVAPPMAPAEAVRGFLDAFEVPSGRIPVSLQAQADLYRSTLAGRRVLVLLDNASDSEQARPLLPGTPGCLAVVTSRNQLTGLVAAEGAHPITLDLLTVAEARGLLTRHLGEARTAAEPLAVDGIVTACARLPIALSVAAARAATHPGFALTALSAELADARSGLDALNGGDLLTDVRAVLSWSADGLSPDAARLFRLLGLHAGPDISATAAASLAAAPVTSVRRSLAELARAHLVQERSPGRFGFHDLLRAYAAEQAAGDETGHEAIGRVLGHYLRAAHAASALLSPHRDPIALAVAAGAPERLADAGHALSWFDTERPALLAAIRQAADGGFDEPAWQLSWAIAEFLQRRGHWHDWAGTQEIAVRAATHLGDRAGQAQSRRGLGRAYYWLGRREDAETQLRIALGLFAALGDDAGRARVHLDLVMALTAAGRHREALAESTQALALYRTTGNRAGQARALNAVGWCHAQSGDYPAAITYCRQAIGLHQDMDDRPGQAATWDSLGYAHHHLGDHPAAASCYEHAIALFREIGDRYGEADSLNHLGESQLGAGLPDSARKAWQDAVEILDALGHPAAAAVRDKLGAAT